MDFSHFQIDISGKKIYGWVGWGDGGLQDYSVSPSPSPYPLDFGFGTQDLDLGLTIINKFRRRTQNNDKAKKLQDEARIEKEEPVKEYKVAK